ncbi:hypothetical protein ABZ924_19530 [Streptomyces sp. NPDC046876]|uniref:hypothetical protein n=1 Tax=Streptomyces sp. NPDC046876 TaxID=3155616 RepID=UPI0033D3EEDD
MFTKPCLPALPVDVTERIIVPVTACPARRPASRARRPSLWGPSDEFPKLIAEDAK